LKELVTEKVQFSEGDFLSGGMTTAGIIGNATANPAMKKRGRQPGKRRKKWPAPFRAFSARAVTGRGRPGGGKTACKSAMAGVLPAWGIDNHYSRETENCYDMNRKIENGADALYCIE
jgi:hypothetical protein